MDDFVKKNFYDSWRGAEISDCTDHEPGSIGAETNLELHHFSKMSFIICWRAVTHFPKHPHWKDCVGGLLSHSKVISNSYKWFSRPFSAWPFQFNHLFGNFHLKFPGPDYPSADLFTYFRFLLSVSPHLQIVFELRIIPWRRSRVGWSTRRILWPPFGRNAGNHQGLRYEMPNGFPLDSLSLWTPVAKNGSVVSKNKH